MVEIPQSDIRLPAELEKAIQHSRNVVTINESEASRLGELVLSREYTIREQQKTIAESERKLSELESNISNQEKIFLVLNKDIADKNAEKLKLENDLHLLRSSLLALKNLLG